MGKRTMEQIAKDMEGVKVDSPKYKKLMAELDKLCGTEEVERDKQAEGEWERNKDPS
jgi:hypothetical protein